MKHATLGVSVAVVAFASLVSSNAAQAIDVRHTAQHTVQLGAPLYAGPNVVVIGDGYSRSTSGYNLTGSVTIYGKPPPRRYGYGNGHGHRYGHRPPPPRYGYGAPRPRYGRDPYRRTVPVYPRRERHPPPHVNVHPNRGPDYGYGGYGNPRHGNSHGPRLTILGATYRSIDGRACNAYSYAHRKCDGTQSCTVKASNSICGDPDRGRLKILEVSYACGKRQYTSNTPERSRSQIRCR